MTAHGWALLGIVLLTPVVVALGVAYVRVTLTGGTE